MSDLFLRILFGVIDRLVLRKFSGENAENVKSAYIRVGNGLEYISSEMIVLIVLSDDRLAGLKIRTFKLGFALN